MTTKTLPRIPSFSSVLKCISFLVIFLMTILVTSNASAQRVTPQVGQPTNPPGAPGPVTGASSVLQGSTYTYSVTAATGATSYAWSLSPSNAGTLTGTTTSVSVHWSSSFSGYAYVLCSAVNSLGSTAGTPLNVTVAAPVTPLISGTISPATQLVNGSSAIANLSTTSPSGGNGIYSYQWQISSNNSTWTNISGAEGTTYPPSNTGNNQYYRLVTTSGSASVVSNTAVVNCKVSPSYSSTNSIVSVNELTGTANVVIPLYSIEAAHVTFPINLIYSANGIKATDVEQNAGTGWQVSVGGAITRQVRGLPDDVTKDGNGNSASGWLYANNGSKISALTFANDNNTGTCSDETQDLSLIASDFTGNTDTEPDIFQVSAPGLSCSMMFDNNNVLRVFPYQDLRVTYQVGAQGAANQGQITSFSITNDEGVTYLFSAVTTVSQSASTTQGSVNYFQSGYNQFKNGITYYSSWGLTQIRDVHNNGINVDYIPASAPSVSNPIQLSVGGASATVLYTVKETITSQLPSSIYATNTLGGQSQSFQISYTQSSTGNYCISDIIGLGHDFNFSYSYVATATGFSRLFLSRIMDETCSAQTVNGQTVALSSYAPLNLNFSYFQPTTLAGPGQNNIDYWGYTNGNTGNTSLLPSVDINPSTAGYERYRNRQVTASPSSIYTYAINAANREADQNSVSGTLSQINYAEGGYTLLSYEPNQYYDNTLQTNVQGGGIRVTQVTDHDGISGDNDFVKTYTYRNLSTGLSNGKAISLPTFVFTTPYSGSNTGSALWTSSTMVSPYDLSGEDHVILYSAVIETVNNGGSTVYQYALPATNWDTSVPANPSWSPSGLPAWSPTITNVGRIQGTGGTCQSEGVLRNDVNTYPFAPNANYDFERGLLTNILKYNSSGTQVSETDYVYQTPETPIDITAFKYDVNGYATNYAKYIVHTSAAPVTSQVVDKVFDLTNVAPGAQPTVALTVTTNNVYNATQHKLTKQTTNNSDGSVSRVVIKYVKDYAITTAGDSYLAGLLALQNENVNMPVEVYKSIVPVNGTQSVITEADLTLFGTFPNQGANYTTGGGLYMGVPQPTTVVQVAGTSILQHRKFISQTGVTDFAPSSVSGTNTFQFDSRYTVTENDLGYDYSGFLISKDDGFKHVKTSIFDNLNSFRLRATVANARYDEIAMDFPVAFFAGKPINYVNSPNAYNFSVAVNSPVNASNIGIASVSRNGETAIALPATLILSKTVSKNISAKNYIFSTWINSTTAGTLTVTATDGTNTVTNTFAFDATQGNSKYPTGFEYCRMPILVTGLTASSNITISFSSNQNINCTDIFAFPDVADIATYAYDSNNNKIGETNGNGVSTYFSYDPLGRLLFVYDQDNNLIERKTYVNNNPAINSVPSVSLAVSTGQNVLSTEIVTITPTVVGYNTCTLNGDTKYSWNFGDGQQANNVGSYIAPINHTYSGTKGQQFTCTLTITSPQNTSAPYSVTKTITL